MALDLDDELERVANREQLVGFIAQMADVAASPEGLEWENVSLAGFLEAMSAWLHDADGYFKNNGMDDPTTPTWRLFGEMLLAATVYE